MALTMTLLAAAQSRGHEAKHVIWSRIDQKTCLKAITAANLVGALSPSGCLGVGESKV